MLRLVSRVFKLLRSQNGLFRLATVVWVAMAAVVLTLVGAVGFTTAIHETSQMEFCISCHSMESTVFQEYKTSPHYRNASGVRAVCSDCHVPKEFGPLLLAKAMAARDVWGEITGTIDTPAKFEAKRLSLAKDVWASMAARDSQECKNCHSFQAMDFHKQRPKAAKMMEPAAQKGETCITCHKGIAHKLPDMASGYKAAFNDLMLAAAQDGAKADTLYTLTTTPLFIDRPTDTTDAPAGKVLPLSRVQVLARDGDLVQVRLAGWQQDGANRMLYAAKGQRIFTAALTPAAAETVQQTSTIQDPDTGLVWHQATIVGWIPDKSLYADREKIAAYGSDMYASSCGTCHALPAPNAFLANQWIGTIDSMKENTPLDDEQVRFLEKYLQFQARDAAAGNG